MQTAPDRQERRSEALRDLPELEKRLRRIAEEELLYQFSERVSHYFGNIIQPIMWSASILTEEAKNTPKQEHLERIERAADHASDIVARLGMLASQAEETLSQIELNEWMQGFLNASRGGKDAVTTSDGPIFVEVEETSLRRLLEALLEYRCPSGPMKEGRIEIGERELKKAYRGWDVVPAGRYATIALSWPDDRLGFDPIQESLATQSRGATRITEFVPLLALALTSSSGGFLDLVHRAQGSTLTLLLPLKRGAPRVRIDVIANREDVPSVCWPLFEAGFRITHATDLDEAMHKFHIRRPALVVIHASWIEDHLEAWSSLKCRWQDDCPMGWVVGQSNQVFDAPKPLQQLRDLDALVDSVRETLAVSRSA